MATSNPVVRLMSGTTARGLTLNVPDAFRSVFGFLGIPYAEPPVKSLRFQPTRPIPLWKGERNCTEYGSIACQNTNAVQLMMHPFEVPKTTSEDCLYLNVWTPALNENAKLPVMIWIHGGAFQTGYSNFYDGTFISGYQDVVVVSINYRLGALGFLATGDGVVKGNMGLLDQVEALKWVKRHIKSFGGDPDNITLFGESAGSISIAFHMLSPLTKGLFKRAICQSGVAVYPSATWPQQNLGKMLRKTLKESGVNIEDGKAIIDYLSTLSPDEIRTACGDNYQPTVDGTYLPDLPLNLYKQGYLHKDVDVMFGFNSDEGAVFIFGMNALKPVSTKEDADRILNLIVDVMFFRGSKKSSELKELLRREYLSDGDRTEKWTHGLIQLHGDLLFVAPTLKCADMQSQMSKSSTYVYAFEQRPTVSRYPGYIKADHAQEIMYVFGEPFLGRLPQKFSALWSDDDKKLSKEIIEMWCRFARTGDPNVDRKIKWPKYTGKNGQYLSIQIKSEVKSSHKPERMRLWNEIIPALLSDSKV